MTDQNSGPIAGDFTIADAHTYAKWRHNETKPYETGRIINGQQVPDSYLNLCRECLRPLTTFTPAQQ